jgi:hypothetical protein
VQSRRGIHLGLREQNKLKTAALENCCIWLNIVCNIYLKTGWELPLKLKGMFVAMDS